MDSQISFSFGDVIIPKEDKILSGNILIDRWSKYWYCFTNVKWKDDLKEFLKLVRKTKPFDSADHCSYAFRIRSSEWILLEWKWDDWETWAWQCILRELKRKNVEQIILVVSRHFWWIYLQNDRYKNIVDVARMAIDKIEN